MTDSKLAVIFDFDDTLVPDTTSELLQENGINPREFWSKDVKSLVTSGFDPTMAFLNKFLDNIGKDRPLGKLTNSDLHNFGKTLDKKFFTGIPQLFNDLKEIVKKYKDIEIEFYIISGGLKDLITGSKTVQDNFTAVYGCELAEDEEYGHLKYIKRAISFTEKTRYIFEINKGFTPEEVEKEPLLVNKDIPDNSRRIPLKNMIYVGDGLTDIPCFSLIMKEHGVAFGVFDPSKEKSAKQALQEYIMTKRVVSAHAPKYVEDAELGALIRAAVTTKCSDITLRRREAE